VKSRLIVDVFIRLRCNPLQIAGGGGKTPTHFPLPREKGKRKSRFFFLLRFQKGFLYFSLRDHKKGKGGSKDRESIIRPITNRALSSYFFRGGGRRKKKTVR